MYYILLLPTQCSFLKEILAVYLFFGFKREVLSRPAVDEVVALSKGNPLGTNMSILCQLHVRKVDIL
jgi:hypothetical protein